MQVAKALGAVVVAVANGAGKMGALEDAGADHRIDASTLHSKGGARKDDYAGLKAAVGKISPGGVDVMFDPVGGTASQMDCDGLKWGGVALVIGFASGDVPRLAMNVPLVKNLSVRGVYWGSHAARAPEELAESLEGGVFDARGWALRGPRESRVRPGRRARGVSDDRGATGGGGRWW